MCSGVRRWAFEGCLCEEMRTVEEEVLRVSDFMDLPTQARGRRMRAVTALEVLERDTSNRVPR